jgi:hypothetical protein
MSRGNIAVLFSQHGNNAYPDSLNNLSILIKDKFSDCEIQYFIGDNSKSLTSLEIDYFPGNLSLFNTSNSAFEFSSWDELYNLNYDDLKKADFILFVSSAWQEMYTGYLDFFSYAKLTQLQSNHENFIAGHIDYYDRPGVLLNKKISHWIRTSFFAMTPNLPRFIGGLSTLQDINQVQKSILNKGLSPNFQYVDLNYFENIFNWLTGTTMQGNTWHSKLDKNDIEFEVFSRKFLSIANEHLLTVKLIEQGYAIFDIGFFSLYKKFNVGIENQIKLRNMHLFAN